MELTDNHFDFLKEVINIGIGRSSNVLNQIVKNRVLLKVPVVEKVKISELNNRLGYGNAKLLSVVSMQFKGELTGKVELIFPSSSAVKIVDLLTDSSSPKPEMDQLRSGSLNEVGNIVLNSLIGTLGNILKIRFKYSIPKFKECFASDVSGSYDSVSDEIIYIEARFFVKDSNIEGVFILFFEIQTFDHFISLLNKSMII